LAATALIHQLVATALILQLEVAQILECIVDCTVGSGCTVCWDHSVVDTVVEGKAVVGTAEDIAVADKIVEDTVELWLELA
jgi:hypothetical protein